MQDCKNARFHFFFVHWLLPIFSIQPSLFQRLIMLYSELSLNSLPFSLRRSWILEAEGRRQLLEDAAINGITSVTVVVIMKILIQ